MTKEIVLTDRAPRPIGPYSQGVLVGSFLFISGQIGIEPESAELVSPEVAVQTRKALENIGEILKARGLSFGDVVKTTVYITNMRHFPELNRAYAQFFSAQPPARSTVEVVSLPKGAKVEIEAVACKQA